MSRDWRNILFYIVLGSLLPNLAWAQLSTRHYLPPVPSYKNSTIELQISTPADMPVNYTVTSASGTLRDGAQTIAAISGSVSRGSPVKHFFYRGNSDSNASGGLGRTTSIHPTALDDFGLVIEADHAIRVIQSPQHNHNRSIIASKGYNGVGTSFRTWSAANNKTNSVSVDNDSAHFISIMALNDATEVVIESSQIFEGFNPATDNPVQLDKFQTFTLVTQENVSITGSLVSATKPITVSSGDVHTQQLVKGQRDGGADQLVPVELAGTHYVVGNMGTSLSYGMIGENGEPIGNRYVQLVALEDDTQIYHESDDGSLHELYSLANAGDVTLVHLPGSQSAVHFFTTKGASAKKFQLFMNSSGNNGSEMGGAVVPALRGPSSDGWFCSGADYVEFATPDATTHFMVYIPTVDLPSLEVDIGNGFVAYNDQSLLAPSITQADPDGAGIIEAVSILVFPEGLTSTNDRISFRSAHRMHVSVGTAVRSQTGSIGYFSDFHYGFLIHDPELSLPTDAYELPEVALDPTPRMIRHCIDVESPCSKRFSILEISSDSGGQFENVDITSTIDNEQPCFEFTPAATGLDLPVTLMLTLEDEHGDTRQLNISLPFNWNDFDGDGLPNSVDLDDDNDGIEDSVELNGTDLSIDSDNDDIPDYIDIDLQTCLSDDGEKCRNIPIIYDQDQDGIPNHLDLDSDGDGIFDIIESNDSNADGLADQGLSIDGQVNLLVDANNDGLHDPLSQPGPALNDTDADNIPDFLDPDDDGDGLATLSEGVPGDSGYPLDSDQDNIPNYLDPDDDGDGALTKDEQPDPNLDGDPNDAVNSNSGDWPDVADYLDAYAYPGADTDGDNVEDVNDLDDDNDGILDQDEQQGDFDQDGIPNQYDIDSDNDSIPDLYELGQQDLDLDGDGCADAKFDLNNNGQPDVLEGLYLRLDTDNDGQPDHRDLDSDNDSLPDIIEAGSIDENGDGLVDKPVDTDADGLADTYDIHNDGALPPVPDTDNDGVRDFQDAETTQADEITTTPADQCLDGENQLTGEPCEAKTLNDVSKQEPEDGALPSRENSNKDSESEVNPEVSSLLGGGFGCSTTAVSPSGSLLFWVLLLGPLGLIIRKKAQN